MSLTQIIAYSAIFGYFVTNLAIGETLQIADAVFNYPAALHYFVDIQHVIVLVLIVPIWKFYRSNANLSTNIIKHSEEYNALLWFVFYTIILSILANVGGVLATMSLEGNRITVPTSTAISGLEPIPILLLSVVFLKKSLNASTIIATVCATIGILFFVLEMHSSDHKHTNAETHDTYYGIILTISWVLLGAIWKVVVKKPYELCIEKDKIFIGSVLIMVFQYGFASVAFSWFLFYPTQIDMNLISKNAFVWIVINGAVYVVEHLTVGLAIALKSPFYLSIVTLVQIPLSVIMDMFVHDYQINIYAICGTFFILCSFVMVEMGKFDSEIFRNKILSVLQYCKCKQKTLKDVETTNATVKVLLIHLEDINSNYGTMVRNK